MFLLTDLEYTAKYGISTEDAIPNDTDKPFLYQCETLSQNNQQTVYDYDISDEENDEVNTLHHNNSSDDEENGNNSNKSEVFEELLEFVDENEVDSDEGVIGYDVRCGYFVNCILHLIDIDVEKVINYLYKVNVGMLKKLIEAGRKNVSFGRLIVKVLDIKEENAKEYRDIQWEMVSLMIKGIDVNEKDEDIVYCYKNIFNVLNELMVNNKDILICVVSNHDNCLEHLINIITMNIKQCYTNNIHICKIYTYVLCFITNILKLIITDNFISISKPTIPSNSNKPFPQIEPFYSNKLLLSSLGFIISNFNYSNNDPIGEINISIIEYMIELFNLMTAIDNNDINKMVDNILIRFSIVAKATTAFCKCKYNDIYCKLYVDFIKTIIMNGDSHKMLIEFMFNNGKYIENIYERYMNGIETGGNWVYDSGRKVGDVRLVFLNYLIYEIKRIESGNKEEDGVFLKDCSVCGYENSNKKWKCELLKGILQMKKDIWDKLVKMVLPNVDKYNMKLCCDEDGQENEDNVNDNDNKVINEYNDHIYWNVVPSLTKSNDDLLSQCLLDLEDDT